MRVVRWVETQRQLWAEQRLNAAQLRYMTLLGEICQCCAVARIIMPCCPQTCSRAFWYRRCVLRTLTDTLKEGRPNILMIHSVQRKSEAEHERDFSLLVMQASHGC